MFSFQHFTIAHDRCAMKVGTDGVLVGAWAHGGGRILDVGSGSGLIALMMAQRFPEAVVDGLEIDAGAVAQSRENVAASPFARRVTIHHTPFQQFAPTAPYAAIVSNPPYFLDATKNPDAPRTLARHASTRFFHDLFRFARQWLVPGGELSLVVPAESLPGIETEAYLLGFLLARRLWVRTAPHKLVERCLVSFARHRLHEAETGEVTLTDASGHRSAWYGEITRDFYLQ